MAIKVYKAITNGRRNMTSLDFAEITTNKPEKSLLAPLPKKAGRNNQGKITVRHHGGGHKKQYRIIDFKRNKDNVPAKVATIEYDPNRSANIALLHYVDGEKRYIIAPKELKVGQIVVSGKTADIKVGNALPLANIPVGTLIHNIELKPGKGGQLVRSAGASAQALGKEGTYVLVRLKSGEVRMITHTVVVKDVLQSDVNHLCHHGVNLLLVRKLVLKKLVQTNLSYVLELNNKFKQRLVGEERVLFTKPLSMQSIGKEITQWLVV